MRREQLPEPGPETGRSWVWGGRWKGYARRIALSQRLGLAFAAVAVLAVAANLVAEHGAQVILKTTQRTITLPAPARPTMPPPRQAEVRAPVASQPSLDTIQAIQAIEQFEHALARRLDLQNASDNEIFQTANRHLASQLRSLGATPGLDSKYRAAFGTQLAALQRQATQLIGVSDARRTLVTAYWTHFESIDKAAKGALDNNWKIFGRVIARQSIVSLSRDLDGLRQLSDQSIGSSPDSLAALAEGLQKFSAGLEQNGRAFENAQGAEWVRTLRQNLSLAIEDSDGLLKLDERRAPTLTSIESQSQTLLATLHAASESMAPKPEVVAAALPGPVPEATVATASETPAAVETVTTSVSGDPGTRLLIGAISAGVLILMLVICVATVRSMVRLAEYDPLTELPNRRQFQTHLDYMLRKAGSSGARVAVFFLDLDNFKNINDSLGHTFGDLILQATAKRLQELAGPDGFIARLGGDEFTLIRPCASKSDVLQELGAQLASALQRPLVIDNREVVISVSIGASIFPDHDGAVEGLERAADAALFQAKRLGRSQLCVFSQELLDDAAQKFRVEQGLRRALDRGEFELYFQPEVSFASLDTKLVEALLRWRLPDGRAAPPSEFLAVAEESGLIAPISDWVLRSAFECAARWHHGSWPDARVAINVSARQLLDGRFVEQVRQLLAEHRLPTRCIEIELTETVLQTGPATIATLRQLRALDISVALDDFGTGYSSLASLEQLPLTRVKLDRSLIDGIDTSSRSLAIARSIIGLCSGLGLDVTAEGIERPEQLALLQPYPHLSLQGYLISHPVGNDTVLAAVAQMPQHLLSLMLSMPVRQQHDQRDLSARTA